MEIYLQHNQPNHCSIGPYFLLAQNDCILKGLIMSFNLFLKDDFKKANPQKKLSQIALDAKAQEEALKISPRKVSPRVEPSPRNKPQPEPQPVQQTTQPSSGSSEPKLSPEDEQVLKKMEELVQKGILSQEEFEKKKLALKQQSKQQQITSPRENKVVSPRIQVSKEPSKISDSLWAPKLVSQCLIFS